MAGGKDRSTKIPRGCKDSPTTGAGGGIRGWQAASALLAGAPRASHSILPLCKCPQMYSVTSPEPSTGSSPHLQASFTFLLFKAQFWAPTDRKTPCWDNPGALCFGLAVTVTAGISLQMDGNGRGTGPVWLCGGGSTGGAVVMDKGGV